MIERYSLPDMAAIFTDEARMQRWVEVEVTVLEALASVGIASSDHAAACRVHAPTVDSAFVREVAERERVTDHDVAAFVDVLQQKVGMPHGAWLHHGLTSTDVVDTAQCWALRDAADLLIEAQSDLIEALIELARAHRDTPMIGRTHGIHAEPTTFGAKVALWALQLDRDRQRMMEARANIAVCKLSGAVGTYSNITPDVEAHVADYLGLIPVPATQVIARDRHAEYLWACASTATTLESIAVELRHLQRTEVGEVREGFKSGQKGSSAMPHKRNPIAAETITGLSRVVRSHLTVGLQDVALWHERDISHSSAERIVLPDASLATHYMLRRMVRLIAGLEVDTEKMRVNLELLNGVVFSQSVLLKLVEAGATRDDAYRIVQDAASKAMAESRSFRSVLEQNSSLGLTSAQLDEAFDMKRVLRYASRAVEALDHLK
ncbi:MAG: adenylosuccinate lyase [Actinobacteria bacterium]|nr:adenylosuccinate lyase [Actinomycetota bacterium]